MSKMFSTKQLPANLDKIQETFSQLYKNVFDNQ